MKKEIKSKNINYINKRKSDLKATIYTFYKYVKRQSLFIKHIFIQISNFQSICCSFNLLCQIILKKYKNIKISIFLNSSLLKLVIKRVFLSINKFDSAMNTL